MNKVYILPRVDGWAKDLQSDWDKQVKQSKPKKPQKLKVIGQFSSIPKISLESYPYLKMDNIDNFTLYKNNSGNLWVGVNVWPHLCVVKIPGKKLTMHKLIHALTKLSNYEFNIIEQAQYVYYAFFEFPDDSYTYRTIGQATAGLVINGNLYLHKRDRQTIIVCGQDS